MVFLFLGEEVDCYGEGLGEVHRFGGGGGGGGELPLPLDKSLNNSFHSMLMSLSTFYR